MSWRFGHELDWMTKAACPGLDGDVFFGGPRGGRPATRRLPCSSCPVRADCYGYARALGPDVFGVFGRSERPPLNTSG